MEEKLPEYKIAERIDETKSKYDRLSTEIQRDVEAKERIGIVQDFDMIVNVIDEVTIEADEKAAKDIKGNVILSPEERSLRKQILVWRATRSWISFTGENKWSKTRMKSLLESIGQNGSTLNRITKEYVGLKIKEAWNDWRDLKETRYRKKMEWRYYQEAQGRQTLGDKREVDKIIASIKHLEQTNRCHSKIKFARGKSHGEGVSFIEIHDEDGNRQQIHERSELEKRAIEACHRKVHTADSTTLWKQPITDIIKIRESTQHWETLFEDSFFRDQEFLQLDISEGAKSFLMEICQRENDEHIVITEEEYWKGCKMQKERTSSHGQINFSHFMCVEKDSYANKCRAKIANFRFETGITPRNYK